MEATSHGPEHVRFYIANLDFKGQTATLHYVLHGGDLFQGELSVARSGYYLYLQGDLSEIKVNGLAYVGANPTIEKFTLSVNTILMHEPTKCFSNVMVCKRVTDAMDLIHPVRNITHFHSDTVQYLHQGDREISVEVLYQLKQVEFEVRYSGAPLAASVPVQHFSVGIWEGDAKDVEVPGMDCRYDADQILDYTLTFSVGFFNDLMHFDGFSTVENTIDKRDEVGNMVKEKQIITWRLIAEARLHKDHIAAEYVAYLPEEPLEPPYLFVASAILKLDQHKNEAHGTYQYQRLLKGDRTAQSLNEIAVGWCRVYTLREGLHTMEEVLQRHCEKLQVRFSDFEPGYFYKDYMAKDYLKK